jgi:hypothetical protein
VGAGRQRQKLFKAGPRYWYNAGDHTTARGVKPAPEVPIGEPRTRVRGF